MIGHFERPYGSSNGSAVFYQRNTTPIHLRRTSFKRWETVNTIYRRVPIGSMSGGLETGRAAPSVPTLF